MYVFECRYLLLSLSAHCNENHSKLAEEGVAKHAEGLDHIAHVIPRVRPSIYLNCQ